ncbi:MAG: transposase [Candidatus Omnitrophica bacterium]|nr:transposase [Candidatus Omnitrophota bacterium]
MPRTARITMENCVYHIITRGNQKQSVFREYSDYEKYLSLLSKYKKRHQFKLYCFCLMPNHVHLILHIEEPVIVNKILRSLNLSYTRFFNFKYKTVGHLWQDRFKSRIIAQDRYLEECMKYIEGNPLRAGLNWYIEDYPWSSYAFRLKKSILVDKLPS